MPEPEDLYLKHVTEELAAAFARVIGPLLGSRPLLTIPQAASKLGLKSVRTVETMIASGELKSVKIRGDEGARGSRRIRQEEIERYIAEREEEG